MKNVKIYSTSTCPHCKNLKSFLDESGIEYKNIDVGSDASGREEMLQKSGQMGVPVLDIDGDIIVGFDRDAIKKALDI